MKAICPKCNTAFEVKTLASLGGTARWQGVSVAERSKIAREAVSARWAKHNKHATDHATNPGQWMQSLHHDSAHFIVNGIPACSNADNGAKIVPGMAWLPHDGCVRKCLRCMRHAENAKLKDAGESGVANT